MVIIVSEERWRRLKQETIRKAPIARQEDSGKLIEFPTPAPTWRFSA